MWWFLIPALLTIIIVVLCLASKGYDRVENAVWAFIFGVIFTFFFGVILNQISSTTGAETSHYSSARLLPLVGGHYADLISANGKSKYNIHVLVNGNPEFRTKHITNVVVGANPRIICNHKYHVQDINWRLWSDGNAPGNTTCTLVVPVDSVGLA